MIRRSDSLHPRATLAVLGRDTRTKNAKPATEEREPRKLFPHDAAERVLIQAMVDGESLRLFRGHVFRSSEHHARCRQTCAVLTSRLRGDSEVDHLDHFGAGLLDHEDVGWLILSVGILVDKAAPFALVGK